MCSRTAKPCSPNVVVLDHGNGTSCAVNLHGATVVSWRVNYEEQLFVSRSAIFDNQNPIRGGIPIVFPHFGPWSAGPLHGFAMIVPWKVEKPPERTCGGDIEAIFSLRDDELTRAYWDHSFMIRYRLLLFERELHAYLYVINPSCDRLLNFDFLFHNYFKVFDVTKCGITSLDGLEFIDKTQGNKVYTEGRDPLYINKWTDNIYKNTPPVHYLINNGINRAIRIQKCNLPDTVIWNPWITAIDDFPDLECNEFRSFVCIEPGHVACSISLSPGCIYEATQILQLNKMNL